MKDPIIFFVCEHGAAKSIIAAAYFNKLAKQTNSNVRAIARGTNPDSVLSPQTVAGLHADGLTPDVPPVSENYELARNAIVKRVKHLFKQ